MKWSDLKSQLRGVALKRLTPHEIDRAVSRGHEFQGVAPLRELLGDSKTQGKARYIFLAEDPEDSVTIDSDFTWYDARENQPKRSSEWRLYYPAAIDPLLAHLRVGDVLAIFVSREGNLTLAFAAAGSMAEARLLAVANPSGEITDSFSVDDYSQGHPIDVLTSELLSELGLDPSPDEAALAQSAVSNVAERLILEWPTALPSGAEVSALVAAEVGHVSPIDDPDAALLTWIEVEAAAYKAWENSRIERAIEDGTFFQDSAPSAEAFRAFTMKLRQSRVSRAGGALQNHIERILSEHRISFEAQAQTENGERPDFLFPGSKQYHDPAFPDSDLRMLAAKFTVKERWRQVLHEAKRIGEKHLLTVDQSITQSTSSAIYSSGIVLVVPAALRSKYRPAIYEKMLSVRDLVAGPLAHLIVKE